MTNVLLVDDHTIVRKGLKQILDETEDIVVLSEASNGQEAIEEVDRNSFDVIVLDISMPGMSGLDVIKQLKTVAPALNVLVLSMHPEEQYAIRSLKAGAAGYLTKDKAPEELITAIRRVATGARYISSTLAERLASILNNGSAKAPHETLSDREYQILCLIGAGVTVRQIADQLSLSIKTVSTYRTRLLRKMNLETNAELMRYTLDNQLVD